MNSTLCFCTPIWIRQTLQNNPTSLFSSLSTTWQCNCYPIHIPTTSSPCSRRKYEESCVHLIPKGCCSEASYWMLIYKNQTYNRALFHFGKGQPHRSWPESGLIVLRHTRTTSHEELVSWTARLQCSESLGRGEDGKVTNISSSNPSNPCVHASSKNQLSRACFQHRISDVWSIAIWFRDSTNTQLYKTWNTQFLMIMAAFITFSTLPEFPIRKRLHFHHFSLLEHLQVHVSISS